MLLLWKHTHFWFVSWPLLIFVFVFRFISVFFVYFCCLFTHFCVLFLSCCRNDSRNRKKNIHRCVNWKEMLRILEKKRKKKVWGKSKFKCCLFSFRSWYFCLCFSSVASRYMVTSVYCGLETVNFVVFYLLAAVSSTILNVAHVFWGFLFLHFFYQLWLV